MTFGALGAAGLGGCPKSSNGDGGDTGSSTPSADPQVVTSDDPEASHVRDVEQPSWDEYPEKVNAKTDDGKTIYRGAKSCFVKLPFDEPPKSWRPRPTEKVPCPPIMRSAHWSHCSGGTLHATEDGSTCLCRRDGNPPPPPHLQDCPRHGK